MMKVFPDSTNLASAEHNGTDLLVEFKDGRRYTYSDVPAEVAQQLFDAKSPGAFLAANIRGFYLFEEYKGAPLQVQAGEPKDITNNVQALLDAAMKAAQRLPDCRARSCVYTKIDEASLWLTRVPKK